MCALAACERAPHPGATETPAEPAVPPAAVYEDRTGNIDAATRERGGAVYAQFCAACHDVGVNRAPERTMLGLMTPESIHRSLVDGVMAPQATPLSAEQKVLVAEFLSQRTMGTAGAAPATFMCDGAAAAFDRSRPPPLAGWGFDAHNTHYIPANVAGLDAANVGSLSLKWALAFPNAVRARSQPALAAGAIFVGSHDGTVYALDRETGCARWTFPASAEVRTGIVIAPWRAGDGNAEPLLYFGDLIGTVYAVKAFTGELVWRMKMDEHPNVTITAAPALHDGTLYVPLSSLEVSTAGNPEYACCTFRGAVVALDAATGEELWRTHTVAETPTRRGRNSHGADQYGPSGAPVWNSPAIDAARGQLYIGTGENYSSPATGTSDAIFAIGLETGDVHWVFQATEGDAWNGACERLDKANCPAEDGPDFDFGAGSVLARGSDGRDYVLAGQKSGVQHALDPDTGRVVWQQKVGRGGVRAGIHFGIAARDGVVFVPVADVPDGNTYDEAPRPGMYALDVASGDYVWRAPAEDLCAGRRFCDPGHSGAISVTPDLVLAGSVDGYLRIYDARTGALLWKYDTAREFTTVNGATASGGSIGGGAAPVVHDGLVIVNSGYGFAGMMPGNVLLALEASSGTSAAR